MPRHHPSKENIRKKSTRIFKLHHHSDTNYKSFESHNKWYDSTIAKSKQLLATLKDDNGIDISPYSKVSFKKPIVLPSKLDTKPKICTSVSNEYIDLKNRKFLDQPKKERFSIYVDDDLTNENAVKYKTFNRLRKLSPTKRKKYLKNNSEGFSPRLKLYYSNEKWLDFKKKYFDENIDFQKKFIDDKISEISDIDLNKIYMNDNEAKTANYKEFSQCIKNSLDQFKHKMLYGLQESFKKLAKDYSKCLMKSHSMDGGKNISSNSLDDTAPNNEVKTILKKSIQFDDRVYEDLGRAIGDNSSINVNNETFKNFHKTNQYYQSFEPSVKSWKNPFAPKTEKVYSVQNKSMAQPLTPTKVPTPPSTQPPVLRTTQPPILRTTKPPILRKTKAPILRTTKHSSQRTNQPSNSHTTQAPIPHPTQPPSLRATQAASQRTTHGPSLRTTQGPSSRTTLGGRSSRTTIKTTKSSRQTSLTDDTHSQKAATDNKKISEKSKNYLHALSDSASSVKVFDYAYEEENTLKKSKKKKKCSNYIKQAQEILKLHEEIGNLQTRQALLNNQHCCFEHLINGSIRPYDYCMFPKCKESSSGSSDEDCCPDLLDCPIGASDILSQDSTFENAYKQIMGLKSC